MVYDGQMKRGAGNVGTVLDGNDDGERVAVRGVFFVWRGERRWCVWGGWESRMFAGWVCPAKRGQMPCGIWRING